MGPTTGEPCERLPFPFYGGYPRFARGWKEIDPLWLFNVYLFPTCNPNLRGHDHDRCPVCSPPNEIHYLLWVGKTHYTPESFMEEAREMGISKRIPNIPDNFQIGKTWVFLAHIEGANGEPGCIMAFRPTHVDLVVENEGSVPDYAEELDDRLGGNLRIVEVIPEEEENVGQ